MSGQLSGKNINLELSISEWHARFKQQAGWTSQLRKYIFQELHLGSCHRVLEVGSGTGVIISDIQSNCSAFCYGLDIDLNRIFISKTFSPGIHFIAADGYQIPILDDTFDQVFCHFYLLWMRDPLSALKEMTRVLLPGGAIILLAEPDYGGRIDYPRDLEKIGDGQRLSLFNKGANPFIGRELMLLLKSLGLRDVSMGMVSWSGIQPFSQHDFDIEWSVIHSDLSNQYSQKTISKLKESDLDSSKKGIRISFTPTFYAWGLKS
jgi:SAM-dependent methyltransferase